MSDSDPEASPVSAYPKRGATIYAVEGAILGVVGLAWMTIRLQLSATCLADEIVFVGFFVAALGNLLGCTLVSDHDISQGAYFSTAACLWGLYSYLVAESLLVTGDTALGPNLYARVFFGSMQLFQVTAGVSLALVTVLTLLAAGAIGQRLWSQTLWVEGLIILAATVQGALHGSVAILVAGAVGVVLLALPVISAWKWFFDSLWWKLLHLGAFVAISVLALVVAWAGQTTTVGLPVLLATLLAVALVRLMQPLPPIDIVSVGGLTFPSAPSKVEVFSVPEAPPDSEPYTQQQAFAPQRAAPTLVTDGVFSQPMFLRPVTFHGETPRPLSVVHPDRLLFAKVPKFVAPGRVSKKTM